MPGQRNTHDGSFCTRLRSYRRDILQPDDADSMANAAGEDIDDLNLNGVIDLPSSSYRENKYGADLKLFVYCSVRGLDSAVLQLWMNNPPVDENEEPESSASAESSSSGDRTGFWYLVDQETITDQQRVLFDDLVPGTYRVLVTAITAKAGETAAIDLYEQHSE